MSDHENDKKRNKLGYQRTSVACSHCRRRKIRCLQEEGDKLGRCQNCIKLRKECIFQPVDQTNSNGEGPSNRAPSETSVSNHSPRERPPMQSTAVSPDPSTSSMGTRSDDPHTGYVGQPIPAPEPSSGKGFGINTYSPPSSYLPGEPSSWTQSQYDSSNRIAPATIMERTPLYDLHANNMNVAPGSFGSVRMHSPQTLNNGQGIGRQFPSESNSIRSLSHGTTGTSMSMYDMQDPRYQTTLPHYPPQNLNTQFQQSQSPYAGPLQQPSVFPTYSQGQSAYSYPSASNVRQASSTYYSSPPGYGMSGQAPNGSQYTSRSRPP